MKYVYNVLLTCLRFSLILMPLFCSYCTGNSVGAARIARSQHVWQQTD
jgi:hypothetical protein